MNRDVLSPHCDLDRGGFCAFAAALAGEIGKGKAAANAQMPPQSKKKTNLCFFGTSRLTKRYSKYFTGDR